MTINRYGPIEKPWIVDYCPPTKALWIGTPWFSLRICFAGD